MDTYWSEPQETYETRRQAFLEFAAAAPGGKGRGGFFSQLCKLALQQDPIDENSIQDALAYVNERHDCADFTVCGLLRLLYLYSDSGLLSSNLVEQTRQTILNFKYWIDEPGYNDLMCFWSENHQIMFHSDEYLAGRTPNPCVLCNTHIKWAALLRRADDLGCDYIATGHYARVAKEGDRTLLKKGLDHNKDQSYALWGLPQHHLARSIFPLGEYTKPEIRQMASDFGLHRVAQKPDSYEICFVPDNDYRRFLRDRVPGLDEEVSGGAFVLSDGTEVGRHEGYPFYTIGQRHGLGLALGTPVYVTDIDADTNTITVGPREALLKQSLVARQINLIKYPDLREERPAVGKIRDNDAGGACLVWQTGDDELAVASSEPRRAITPGQAVVLYEGEDVLAGAWIHEVGEPVAA